ncbi:MAG: NAD(P)H-hydrate dehydratase [bacterium]
MEKTKITPAILKKLFKPAKHSYKGKNGRLLVIAGSKKYHGAMFLCSVMSAKIVDFLYIHTTKENFSLIKKVRNRLAEFIYIDNKDLKRTVREVDSILIGPGLLPDKKTGNLVCKLLRDNPEKKFLLDAGALRVVDKSLLNENCVITPHRQEFKALFGVQASLESAYEISFTCPAVIILKGPTDYVIQKGKVFYNTTGNAGMTKGGTGDVLAGLMAGLMTKADPLTSAKQAIYANGKAGDNLYKKFKHYYNAIELIPAVQKVLAGK